MSEKEMEGTAVLKKFLNFSVSILSETKSVSFVLEKILTVSKYMAQRKESQNRQYRRTVMRKILRSARLQFYRSSGTHTFPFANCSTSDYSTTSRVIPICAVMPQ